MSDGLTALAHEAGLEGRAQGVGPLLQMVFADHEVVDCRDFLRSSDNEAYRAFWRGMVDGGVMFAPQPTGCWFVSGAHTEEEIDKTLEVAGAVLMKMAAGSDSRATGAKA